MEHQYSLYTVFRIINNIPRVTNEMGTPDAQGREGAVGIVTGWPVRGSNPVGGEIFRTRPDRPWGPPSLLYNGYPVFPGGKRARA